jgi:hypothetical protein
VVAERRQRRAEDGLRAFDGVLGPGVRSTAASASVARIGRAATPPNAKRARARGRPHRIDRHAAATVLMSSSRRFETL